MYQQSLDRSRIDRLQSDENLFGGYSDLRGLNKHGIYVLPTRTRRESPLSPVFLGALVSYLMVAAPPEGRVA